MAINNAIGPYYETTSEFVDELQNYLKVSKVCDNEHLTDCFGYDKIKTKDGFEVVVGDLKTGSSLGMKSNAFQQYDNTVGIITIDGTGMILSWNKKCPILEPKVYPWGGNTNETTSCVATVMDVNQNRDVNTLNKDVVLFNARTLKGICPIKIEEEGICWSAPFAADKKMDLTDPAECDKFVAAGGNRTSCNKITQEEYNSGKYYTKGNLYADGDAWAYAVTYSCGGTQNMPSQAELAKLPKYVYKQSSANYYKLSNLPSGITEDLELDMNAMGNLGLAPYYTSHLALWSNDVYSGNYTTSGQLILYSNRVFNSTMSRGFGNRHAICFGEM